MDRQSFVPNAAQKYNGARSSLSGWFSTAPGAYVLGWELAQFDSAVEDVFGFRAVQIGLPEVDFLRQNRIPFRFSLALEPGASLQRHEWTEVATHWLNAAGVGIGLITAAWEIDKARGRVS